MHCVPIIVSDDDSQVSLYCILANCQAVGPKHSSHKISRQSISHTYVKCSSYKLDAFNPLTPVPAVTGSD